MRGLQTRGRPRPVPASLETWGKVDASGSAGPISRAAIIENYWDTSSKINLQTLGHKELGNNQHCFPENTFCQSNPISFQDRMMGLVNQERQETHNLP